MGYATPHQAKSNNANDSIFAVAMVQAFTGFAFGPEVDMAWEAAETASAIYTDRYSSSAQTAQRTNGKYELGVKNSLGPAFTRQTNPGPAVDFDAFIPSWLKDPAPRRAHALSF